MITLLLILLNIFAFSSALVAVTLWWGYEPNTSQPSRWERVVLLLLAPGLALLSLAIMVDWRDYRETLYELYSLIVYGHDLRDGNWDD